MLHSASDADFYTAVHHLTQQHAAQSDRRDQNRRAYACRQRMAYAREDAVPADHEFVDVECRDLSAHGLSYLAAQPPGEKTLVFALGVPPYTYLQAEVIHSEQLDTPAGTCWMIGCQFTGRLRA